MLMKRILLLAALFMIITAVKAQVITGTVKDARTGEVLPYVNVGVVAKGIGTVTNDNGKFSLTLNKQDADSLRISMIGYLPQSYAVSALKKNTDPLNVALVPSNKQLREVRIS